MDEIEETSRSRVEKISLTGGRIERAKRDLQREARIGKIERRSTKYPESVLT